MGSFFEGTGRARDYAANATARFHPAVAPEDNNGAYALPCIEIGGVQVYAYVRDGILVVSLDYDTADTSPASPFALYGPDDAVPTVVTAGHGAHGRPGPVWDALPADAVTEADARLLRKAGEYSGYWVLPGWVDHE